jgi:hypothetical protein
VKDKEGFLPKRLDSRWENRLGHSRDQLFLSHLEGYIILFATSITQGNVVSTPSGGGTVFRYWTPLKHVEQMMTGKAQSFKKPQEHTRLSPIRRTVLARINFGIG